MSFERHSSLTDFTGSFKSVCRWPFEPTQITSVELAGVRVRYLNFKWDEEAFEVLEKSGDMPGAKRSWAIARLYPSKPIMVDGKQISGGNLLILNPARDDTPMNI